MGQRSTFKIDLNKIDGDGEFPCPSCRAVLSPDDESGLTYDIIDVKMEEGGSLKELVIICKKCKSIIHLEGFEALNELDNSEE